MGKDQAMSCQDYIITKAKNFYWVDPFRSDVKMYSFNPIQFCLLSHETGRNLIDQNHVFAIDYVAMSYLLDMVNKNAFPSEWIDFIKNSLIEIINDRNYFNN